VKSALIQLQFLTVALQEPGTRKVIFWSVNVYSKHLCIQCSLSSVIAHVQDKIVYVHVHTVMHNTDAMFMFGYQLIANLCSAILIGCKRLNTKHSGT
jgi:hypothetical protein